MSHSAPDPNKATRKALGIIRGSDYLWGICLLPLLALIFLPSNALISLTIKSQLSTTTQSLLDGYILHVAIFSLKQAFLSAVLSCVLGMIFAYALFFSGRFWARSYLLKFCAISLVLPVIPAIIGMFAVHGYNGWVNDLLVFLGVTSERKRYFSGLTGILIAHTLLNLPIVIRLVLLGLYRIPVEQWRLARSYNMPALIRFFFMEWQVLKPVIYNAFILIFLLCFVSFAVVLTVGGSPAYATIETAIYQAIKYDFDLAHAALLSLVQIGLCGFVLLPLFVMKSSPLPTFSLTMEIRMIDLPLRRSGFRYFCWAVIGLGSLFMLSPLFALLLAGASLRGIHILQEPTLWQAVGFSLAIASAATVVFLGALSGLMVLILHGAFSDNLLVKSVATIAKVLGQLILVFPPYVIATGLFILIVGFGGGLSAGPYLVILINAIMALPFGLAVIYPPLIAAEKPYRQLAQQLNIKGINRFIWIIWPEIAKPAALCVALAFCLSLGDLGVIALFGSHNFASLPLYIYNLAASYKLPEAMTASALLLGLFFLCFWAIETSIRRLKC